MGGSRFYVLLNSTSAILRQWVIIKGVCNGTLSMVGNIFISSEYQTKDHLISKSVLNLLRYQDSWRNKKTDDHFKQTAMLGYLLPEAIV